MNAKNLPLKFALFVVLPVALCLYSITLGNGLKTGIDLAGGHSMIFEIRTDEARIQRLAAEVEKLQETFRATPANSPKRKTLQEQLSVKTMELQSLRAELAGAGGNLAEEMIKILKDRVDRQGLRNIEWRPVGRTRIEVRMPASSPESQQAGKAFQDALVRLEETNLKRSELRRLLKATPASRPAVIDEIDRDDKALAEALRDFAATNDAANATEEAIVKLSNKLKGLPADTPEKTRKDLAEALGAAEAERKNVWAQVLAKRRSLQEGNVSRRQLREILRNYVPPQDARTIDGEELKSRQDALATALAALRTEHPGRNRQIDEAVEAYKKWAGVRKHLDDPADLKRLIRKAGVLEFRIVPERGRTADVALQVGADELDRYRKLLLKDGPDAARKKNQKYAWFPVHGDSGFDRFHLADYAGKTYVLLCNEPKYAMLQKSGKTRWKLKNAMPDYDETGRQAIGFTFNETGAKLFAALTGENKGRPMAILLDDEVYSAPTIQSIISSRGIITGRFTGQEVSDLVRTLKAGSLPGRLSSEPVAESSFGPAIGQKNKERGVRAAYGGLIAVAAFILLYYILAGAIANVALVLNIIFVLGAMSLTGAVFTLPGIAGVILTIGIAVDANVLIFERLREEQAKNQTVRMALKNAYERAFSAIFDANLTTLLTCLILGWVGTTEVRGFAITLGLGILFSLFSALVITRWIFQFLLDARLLKKPVFMVRLIGTPNVNWMAKRHLFWCVSVVLMATGIASLVWQGKDVWGIEFSGGTKATITLKQDAALDGQEPDDALIGARFKQSAAGAGFEKLATTARVETVYEDDPTQPSRTYQITTSETDLTRVREVLRKAFGKVLDTRTKCEFDLVKGGLPAGVGVAAAPDGLTTIVRGMAQGANPAVQDLLEDFTGGVMILVENLVPAISVEEFKQRVADMRMQPDFDSVRLDETEAAGLGAATDGRYAAFAVFVSPADPSASRSPQVWKTFKDSAYEWIVQEPLHREEAITVNNFDPQIATEASGLAIVAIVLSCVAIVLYLWFRFGSVQWGLAAVVCLVHDVIIVVGLIAVSGWIHNTFVGKALGIGSFKIDLAMIAAILTVIGYSVNDTIVVFDRIRENRGKLTTLSPQVLNASINQTLSRTLLTSGTTFIVVFIMYVWGGPGIHAFNYALLAGIIFGTYSSVAIASPLLLGFKQALVAKTGPGKAAGAEP